MRQRSITAEIEFSVVGGRVNGTFTVSGWAPIYNTKTDEDLVEILELALTIESKVFTVQQIWHNGHAFLAAVKELFKDMTCLYGLEIHSSMCVTGSVLVHSRS